MGIIKEIFGKVRIYQLRSRVDSRGLMSYVFDENIYDFSIKETRIYSMPKEGTFFGIHYKEESSPMTKLVTVIKGKGMDYVIDLRKGSTKIEFRPFSRIIHNRVFRSKLMSEK